MSYAKKNRRTIGSCLSGDGTHKIWDFIEQTRSRGENWSFILVIGPNIVVWWRAFQVLDLIRFHRLPHPFEYEQTSDLLVRYCHSYAMINVAALRNVTATD